MSRPSTAGERTGAAPIVIVGNGGAAVHACMALRGSGYAREIRLYSDHAEPPYNPMLTTYYVARSGRGSGEVGD
ncbi:MAG: hypothetical protein M1565_00045 [Actinobacteria bacterium]|nr:hypothetical protein [Actinomycetota bacterium]